MIHKFWKSKLGSRERYPSSFGRWRFGVEEHVAYAAERTRDVVLPLEVLKGSYVESSSFR